MFSQNYTLVQCFVIAFILDYARSMRVQPSSRLGTLQNVDLQTGLETDVAGIVDVTGLVSTEAFTGSGYSCCCIAPNYCAIVYGRCREIQVHNATKKAYSYKGHCQIMPDTFPRLVEALRKPDYCPSIKSDGTVDIPDIPAAAVWETRTAKCKDGSDGIVQCRVGTPLNGVWSPVQSCGQPALQGTVAETIDVTGLVRSDAFKKSKFLCCCDKRKIDTRKRSVVDPNHANYCVIAKRTWFRSTCRSVKIRNDTKESYNYAETGFTCEIKQDSVSALVEALNKPDYCTPDAALGESRNATCPDGSVGNKLCQVGSSTVGSWGEVQFCGNKTVNVTSLVSTYAFKNSEYRCCCGTRKNYCAIARTSHCRTVKVDDDTTPAQDYQSNNHSCEIMRDRITDLVEVLKKADYCPQHERENMDMKVDIPAAALWETRTAPCTNGYLGTVQCQVGTPTVGSWGPVQFCGQPPSKVHLDQACPSGYSAPCPRGYYELNNTCCQACFHNGFRYLPLNMEGQGKSTEQSSEHCQMRCRSVSRCAHFSYWQNGACYLQDGSATLYTGRGTVGPPECKASLEEDGLLTKTEEQAISSKACFYNGFRYLPLNMEGQGKSLELSSEHCQIRCKSVSDCAHFSYWQDGGCHLQDSSATLYTGKGTVGPPECKAYLEDNGLLNETEEQACFYTGFVYRPLNMKGQSESIELSSKHCQKRCESVFQCAHFSYWEYGGCYLQDASATLRKGRGTVGPPKCEAATYVRADSTDTCPHGYVALTDESTCAQNALKIQASLCPTCTNQAFGGVGTWDNMASGCVVDPTASSNPRGVFFNKGASNVHPGIRQVCQTPTTPTTTTTSDQEAYLEEDGLPTKTEEQAISSEACFSTGFKYLPLNMQKQSVSIELSSEHCQKRCRSVKDCAHFSYLLDGNCHLQDDSATLRRGSGIVGPRGCKVAEIMDVTSLLRSYAFDESEYSCCCDKDEIKMIGSAENSGADQRRNSTPRSNYCTIDEGKTCGVVKHDYRSTGCKCEIKQDSVPALVEALQDKEYCPKHEYIFNGTTIEIQAAALGESKEAPCLDGSKRMGTVKCQVGTPTVGYWGPVKCRNWLVRKQPVWCPAIPKSDDGAPNIAAAMLNETRDLHCNPGHASAATIKCSKKGWTSVVSMGSEKIYFPPVCFQTTKEREERESAHTKWPRGAIVRIDYCHPEKNRLSKLQNSMHSFNGTIEEGTNGRVCLMDAEKKGTGCFLPEDVQLVEELEGFNENDLEKLDHDLKDLSLALEDLNSQSTRSMLDTIGIRVTEKATSACKQDAAELNMAALSEIRKHLTPVEKVVHGLVKEKSAYQRRFSRWMVSAAGMVMRMLKLERKAVAEAGKEEHNMRSLLVGHSTDVKVDLDKALELRMSFQSLGRLAAGFGRFALKSLTRAINFLNKYKTTIFLSLLVVSAIVALTGLTGGAAGGAALGTAAAVEAAEAGLMVVGGAVLRSAAVQGAKQVASWAIGVFLGQVGTATLNGAYNRNSATNRLPGPKRVPMLWSHIEKSVLFRLTGVASAYLLMVRPLETHSAKVLANCGYDDHKDFWERYSDTFASDIGRTGILSISIAINKTSVADLGTQVNISWGSGSDPNCSNCTNCTVINATSAFEVDARQIQVNCSNGSAWRISWINLSNEKENAQIKKMTRLSESSSRLAPFWEESRPIETTILYRIELETMSRALEHYADKVEEGGIPWMPQISVLDFQQTCHITQPAICGRLLMHILKPELRKHVLANCACFNTDKTLQKVKIQTDPKARLVDVTSQVSSEAFKKSGYACCCDKSDVGFWGESDDTQREVGAARADYCVITKKTGWGCGWEKVRSDTKNAYNYSKTVDSKCVIMQDNLPVLVKALKNESYCPSTTYMPNRTKIDIPAAAFEEERAAPCLDGSEGTVECQIGTPTVGYWGPVLCNDQPAWCPSVSGGYREPNIPAATLGDEVSLHCDSGETVTDKTSCSEKGWVLQGGFNGWEKKITPLCFQLAEETSHDSNGVDKGPPDPSLEGEWLYYADGREHKFQIHIEDNESVIFRGEASAEGRLQSAGWGVWWGGNITTRMIRLRLKRGWIELQNMKSPGADWKSEKTNWTKPSIFAFKAGSGWQSLGIWSLEASTNRLAVDNMKSSDGNPWNSEQNTDQWIILTKKVNVTLKGFRIKTADHGKGSSFKSYKFQSSDDRSNWTNVSFGAGTDQSCCDWKEFLFPKKTAKYWRLYMDDNYGNAQISIDEMQVKQEAPVDIGSHVKINRPSDDTDNKTGWVTFLDELNRTCRISGDGIDPDQNFSLAEVDVEELVEAKNLFNSTEEYLWEYKQDGNTLKKLKCCVSSKGKPTKLQDMTDVEQLPYVGGWQGSRTSCASMFGGWANGYYNGPRGNKGLGPTCPVPITLLMDIVGKDFGAISSLL